MQVRMCAGGDFLQVLVLFSGERLSLLDASQEFHCIPQCIKCFRDPLHAEFHPCSEGVPIRLLGREVSWGGVRERLLWVIRHCCGARQLRRFHGGSRSEVLEENGECVENLRLRPGRVALVTWDSGVEYAFERDGGQRGKSVFVLTQKVPEVARGPARVYRSLSRFPSSGGSPGSGESLGSGVEQ